MTRWPNDKEVAVAEGECITSQSRTLLHRPVGVERRRLASDRGVASSAGPRGSWDSRFESRRPHPAPRVRSLFLIEALALRQNTCLG